MEVGVPKGDPLRIAGLRSTIVVIKTTIFDASSCTGLRLKVVLTCDMDGTSI